MFECIAATRAAPRPGGRPVILDGEPAATDRALNRERQFSRHVMARSLVENELVEAGFRMLLSRPAFARLHQGETAWLLAAEPASGAE